MSPKKQKTLDSILKHVLRSGWTEGALREGAKKSGASAAEIKQMFPHGMEDVVEAFHQSIDEAMHTKIKNKRNYSVMRVRDKVGFAVRARLEAIESKRDAMRRLLIWSLRPKNIRTSTQHLWHAADAIWVEAGDTSTDYNYYTKRFLLIAVMKTTLAFWLNDYSQGYRDTWEFLDRRIGDVMKVGKGMNVIKTIGIEDILSFVRSRLAA